MQTMIHRVEKITVDKVAQLNESKTYHTTIEVVTKDNGTIQLTLFAKDLEKLLIQMKG